jgi:hypothetical protein
MFGSLEQKLLGRLQKRFVFLESNFYVSENFQVSNRNRKQMQICGFAQNAGSGSVSRL